jgi:cysteine-rich repeat protein
VDGDGCSATCKEEYCGNGVEDFGEECDPGTGGGIDEYEAADDSADCNYDCTIPYCGDSYVNPKEVNDDGSPVEQCDDGNYDNGDGCAYDCTLEECGNGVQDEYEDCDDGNLDDGDGCSQYCTIEACGNGVIDYGEDCDPDTGTYFYDGIWADYASADCDDDCTLPECGDGILNDLAENTAASGTEQCDDGNFDEGDGCSPYCTLEECGNGETDPPWEDCDDGNLTDGDGCSQFCEIEACGNGEIDYGEECDPDTGTTADSYVAAANSADCTLNCTYSFCGDDVVNNEADEECDPDMGESDSPVMSNDDSADCTMFCTASFCGDGWTNYAANEECDPGLTCDDGSDCTYSGVCDDGSSCALRGDSYCDFNCTYAPDVTGLCCFDYDYENDVYLYTASAGQTSSDCTDNDGRFEASSEDAATPGEQDALCGWTGACCELGDTGEVIDAYASTYDDCFGEYKTAAEADEDRDGHVSHEEAQKVCDFVQEYVCLDEGGGFTERTDGGAVQDADGYVEGGKYIFRTTGHPYCRTVWRMSDCSPAAYADVAAAGEAFATDQQYCSSI